MWPFKSENKLEIIIQDDLSGLTDFKVNLKIKRLERSASWLAEEINTRAAGSNWTSAQRHSAIIKFIELEEILRGK